MTDSDHSSSQSDSDSEFVEALESQPLESGPPRKKQKTTRIPKRLQNNELYRVFFNKELKSFIDGDNGTLSKGFHSFVTPFESNNKVSQIESSTILGTYWTSFEKEVFFEFLARFGILGIDKICEKLPRKSILEVMNYYDLLEQGLDHYKQDSKFFMKLIKYEEIPQAMEIDEVVISIEEALSNSLNLYESEKKNSKELQSIFEQEVLNDEESIIDMKVLNSMCEFIQQDHLISDIRKFNQGITPRLGYSSNYIQTLIKNFIHDLISKIIEIQIYKPSPTSLNLNIHQDKISIDVNAPDVYKSFMELAPKRAFLLKYYFHKFHKRLGLLIEDSDESVINKGLLTFNRTAYKFSDYRKNELIKQIYGVEKPVVEEEEEDDDEEEDDELLDNRFALKVFHKENHMVDLKDLVKSREYCKKMITKWGHLELYEQFKQDDDEIESIDDIFQELNQDETLQDLGIPQDLEITDEMITLQSITF